MTYYKKEPLPLVLLWRRNLKETVCIKVPQQKVTVAHTICGMSCNVIYLVTLFNINFFDNWKRLTATNMQKTFKKSRRGQIFFSQQCSYQFAHRKCIHYVAAVMMGNECESSHRNIRLHVLWCMEPCWAANQCCMLFALIACYDGSFFG